MKRPIEELLGGDTKSPPAQPQGLGLEVDFLYDSEKGNYYRKSPSGSYVKTSERDLKRHLQRSGFYAKGDGGNGLTAFEDEVCKAQDYRAVDHVIALAGHAPGIFTTADGRKILVPRGPQLAPPKCGPLPNWQTLLAELFGEQTEYVLGWLKTALEDLYGMRITRWHHNQMLALVGEPNCGKSFFQHLLTILLGGRSSDPYLWMIGRSNFNEDLAESEHLSMGDKNSFRDSKSRSAFGSVIKELAVDSKLAIHGKGKKAITCPTFRRITISINNDADYVTVLPILEKSVADKIMLLSCGRASMVPDYEANLRRFVDELPALVHYLLNVHQIPEHLRQDRFGVATYHSPAVVELLEQFDPLNRFRELVELTLRPETNDSPLWWRGSASELQKKLAEGEHSHLARQLLTYSSACGQYLRGLADRFPNWVEYSDSQGHRTWRILALD
ncbi:MAG: hypothetical protein E6Q97_28945 [Desulfurellales bacterium]|nr:MAG: hypothetical protein E6Q97_28945 [Desulfurellales bacterium]